MGTKFTTLADVAAYSIVGAAYGGVLATIGNVISSSPLAVGLTIAGCAMFGICQRSIAATSVAAFCGVLITALGSLMGGSLPGVLVTMIACGLLGVLLSGSASESTLWRRGLTRNAQRSKPTGTSIVAAYH